MVLSGDYESIRDFIYELESAPEFVIIDDVTLAESDEAEQTLTIDLSTYFRLRPQWRLSGAGSCCWPWWPSPLAALAYRLWPSSTAASVPASSNVERHGADARRKRRRSTRRTCISRRWRRNGRSRRR